MQCERKDPHLSLCRQWAQTLLLPPAKSSPEVCTFSNGVINATSGERCVTAALTVSSMLNVQLSNIQTD